MALIAHPHVFTRSRPLWLLCVTAFCAILASALLLASTAHAAEANIDGTVCDKTATRAPPKTTLASENASTTSIDGWEQSVHITGERGVWAPEDKATFFGHPSLENITEEFKALKNFLVSCGFTSRKIELRQSGLGDFNMYFTEDVTDEEPLLATPGACFLHPFNPNLLPSTKRLVQRISELFWAPGIEYVIADQSRILAIIALMNERANPESKFARYLASLPSPVLPFMLTDEEVAPVLFDRPRDASVAFATRAQLLKDLNLVLASDPLFEHLAVNTELRDWAISIICSRTFAWGRKHYHFSMTLVPGIDLINHDNDVPNKYHYTSAHEMVYTPGRPAVKGESAAISYHPNYPNSPLLSDYGFMLKRNSRDHIFVSFTPAVLANARRQPAAQMSELLNMYPSLESEASAPDDDEDEEDKSSSSSSSSADKKYADVNDVDADGNPVSSGAAGLRIPFFAVLSYGDHIPPALLASLNAGAFGHFDGPTLATYDHVISVFRAALSDYPTTLEQDDALLDATSESVAAAAAAGTLTDAKTGFTLRVLTARERLVVMYAAETKRLLTDLLKTAESDRSELAISLALGIEEVVRPLLAATKKNRKSKKVIDADDVSAAESAAVEESEAEDEDEEPRALTGDEIEAVLKANPGARERLRAYVMGRMDDVWHGVLAQSLSSVAGEEALRTLAIPLARDVSRTIALKHPGLAHDEDAYLDPVVATLDVATLDDDDSESVEAEVEAEETESEAENKDEL